MTLLGIGQAVRVVVVEPGCAGWFLLGIVAGLAAAAVIGLSLLRRWRDPWGPR